MIDRRERHRLWYQINRHKVYCEVGEALISVEPTPWTPYREFMRRTFNEFQHYYGCIKRHRDAVLVEFDSPCGIEVEGTDDNIVLLRSIFTFSDKRGLGFYTRAIEEILNCSSEAKCCVLVVSNPFDIVVPESLRDRKDSYAEGTWLRYVDKYEVLQEKQTARFLRKGFQQIDISESIENQDRCPPEHCLIYVPPNCDEDFVKRLKPRLLLPASF